jgi:hypothetical protein
MGYDISLLKRVKLKNKNRGCQYVVAWNEDNDNRKYYPTSKILQIKFLSMRQN